MALKRSAGRLSDSADLLFFSDLIALCILLLLGVLQFIGRFLLLWKSCLSILLTDVCSCASLPTSV